MGYGNVLCVASHPVDLDNGRVVSHGDFITSLDLDNPHNKVLLDERHLIPFDSAPVHSPRTASGEPNVVAPPKKSDDDSSGGK
jgi:hypothetical protein